MHATANVKGCIMYIYPTLSMPAICSDCCKNAIQAGIKEFVYFYREDSEERWKKLNDISKSMCDEAGVGYIFVKEE